MSTSRMTRPITGVVRNQEIEAFTDDVVAQRCAVLPVRLYDIFTDRFVSRRELSKAVRSSVIQLFNEVKRPAVERFRTDEKHEIKQLVLAHTEFAILSHTWGDDEPTYQGVCSGTEDLSKIRKFAGFSKVAADFGHRYIWLDTVCIDKSSSSEVDESIRSMFMWYRMAQACIVYLDCEDIRDFPYDRWFRRGWTLQELLAPRRIVFFGRNWERLFSPSASEGDPAFITRRQQDYDVVRKFQREGYTINEPEIDVEHHYATDSFINPQLLHRDLGVSEEDLAAYTPSPKNARTMFAYMHERKTTVPEDAAYCLLGLLGIVMPVAYGEGKEHALYRLQVTCLEKSNERNLFIWDSDETSPSKFNSILPRNPFTVARDHARIVAPTAPALGIHSLDSDEDDDEDLSFSFTNAGLRIPVILHSLDENGEIAGKKVGPVWLDNIGLWYKLAVLGIHSTASGEMLYAILLERVARTRQYRRVRSIRHSDLPPTEVLLGPAPKTIYII